MYDYIQRFITKILALYKNKKKRTSENLQTTLFVYFPYNSRPKPRHFTFTVTLL